MKENKFETVSEYIKAQPKEQAKMLKQMRELVKKNAPNAVESISYNVPYYNYNGRFLYFCSFPKHIGFYPMPSAITEFKKDIHGKYKYAKGSVQFPVDKLLPVGLIAKIIKFMYKENSVKIKTNKKK